MNNRSYVLIKFRTMAANTLFFLISIAFTYPGTALADEQSLIEGAKKEGKLVIYTSMNLADANVLLQEFKKKYPFLDVALTRSSSEPLLTKLEQETRAKRYFADAIVATFTIWNDLARKGMLMKYKSPGSAMMPKRMKSPDDFWNVLYLQVMGIAYNSDMVPRDLAPKDYADLLSPRWKGKIGLDNNDQQWFAVLLEIMGEQRGLDFMRKLAGQNLYIRVGKPLLLQLMAAHEFPILANVFVDTAMNLKKKGAHIEWLPGSNPIPTSTALAGIYAYTPHPNAAKLYMDFLLSNEGQKILTRGQVSKFPAMPGVESELTAKVKGYDLFPVDPAMMSNYDSINKRFIEIFRRH